MNKKIVALITLAVFSGAQLTAGCTSCSRKNNQRRRPAVRQQVKRPAACTTCPRNR